MQTTYTSLNQVAIQSLDTQIAIKLQQLHTTIYVNSNNLLQHERKISSGFKDISIQPNPNHCMAIDTDQSTTDTDTIPNSQAPLMIEPIETQNTIKTGDMDTLDHIETHLTPHTILTIDHMTFVFTESKNKVYITIYLNKQQMSSEEMKGNRIINITLNESKKNIIIITNEQFRYHITNIALKDNIPCAKTIFLDNPQPLDLTTSFSLEDNLVMITLQESNKIACYLYNLADFNETTLMLENTQTFASKPSINAFTLYAIDNNSYILKKHTISFSYGQFNIQSVDIHALPAHLHKTYILSLHPTSEMFIISNCEQTLLTTIAILEKNLIAPILYKIELSSPMKLGDLSCFIPSKNTLIQCNPTGYSIITDFGEKPAQATCALKLKDDSFIKTLQFDQTRQRLIVISESDSHTHTHYYNINHLMIYHEGI
ncbi:MAG: hypothetical protein HAW62_05450 [Endozoicomonadaceae bacterium]|nr:hypothetical protein [Endozoicomonadaceae bacterium]